MDVEVIRNLLLGRAGRGALRRWPQFTDAPSDLTVGVGRSYLSRVWHRERVPKRYGTKSADVVVAYIIGALFDGRLRAGDRIDRNEVAAALGLSRVPVQEALLQLERDGVVTTRYHRGAFIERFDADAVREHYELFGLLNGYAAARAARRRTPELVGALESLVATMRTAAEPEAFDQAAWEFRRRVNRVAAGPRLRAMLKNFAGFIPAAYRQNWPQALTAILPCYQAELAAIRSGDAAEADAAARRRAAILADMTVADLVRRGVLPPEPAGPGSLSVRRRSRTRGRTGPGSQ